MSARPQRRRQGWIGVALFFLFFLSFLSMIGAWALCYLGKCDVYIFASCSALFAVLATLVSSSGSISLSEIISLLQVWRL